MLIVCGSNNKEKVKENKGEGVRVTGGLCSVQGYVHAVIYLAYLAEVDAESLGRHADLVARAREPDEVGVEVR